METLKLSRCQVSRLSKSGRLVGRAKTLATRTQNERASKVSEVDCFISLQTLLEKYGLVGLSWKMSLGSSAQKEVKRLSQLSTSSKRLGIWGGGSRATLSMRVCLTTEIVFSLLQVIDPNPPISSFLTAANCTGILRREKNNQRLLDQIFEVSLLETLRFWFSVGEASGTPKQKVLAPRFVPKLEVIKEVIRTDQFYVARNLTWDECEKLMGFPEGWTAVEGDSLAMQSHHQSSSGLGDKSSRSKRKRVNGETPSKNRPISPRSKKSSLGDLDAF